jgi:flap endonuclease-1
LGVNLSGLVEPRNVELSELRGRTVAVDAYNTIYQFLSIIRQPDGTPLKDSRGRVTSHLSGLLYRTANLIEAGVEPTYVFDGRPHALKYDTIEGRKARREKAEREWEEAVEEGDLEKAFSKAQQTSRMTSDVLASSKGLLRALGVPTVDAPGDGEAQGAYMCSRGDVWAAASQDYDSLLFGAPTLVRNVTVTGRRKVPGKNVYRDVGIEVIDSAESLAALGITREQLVDVCILMGTDFNPGIPGIGPKKGLKLIKEHGSLERALERMGSEIEEAEEGRDIFLHGEYCDGYDLRPGCVDRDAVLGMMTDHAFSPDRVSSALERMESSRKAEAARRRQKSLDCWF